MIKLSNTPMEGTSVKLNLGFRDSLGKYYVPNSLKYTLLALNNDKETWQVVNEIYKVEVTPASVVILTLDKVGLVPNTTRQRRVIIEWSGFVDNQLSDFVDEICFEIKPMPYITNIPAEPEVKTIYVEIKDVEFQTGAQSCSPTRPIITAVANMPCKIDDAEIIITDGETDYTTTFSIDSTRSRIEIIPDDVLEKGTEYTLVINGLKSMVDYRIMEKPFEFKFVTTSAASSIEDLEIEIQNLQLMCQNLDERVSALEGNNP